jgi:mRNA interferase MazF
MKYKSGTRRKAAEYEKDFDGWNELKKQLSDRKKIPEFKEREVWWCPLGVNLGFEEDGKNKNFERPVLVFRKFNRWLFAGVPLTTKNKNNEFHFRLPCYKNIDSSVILSQARTLSAKRLIRRVRWVEPKVFDEICRKYAELTIKTSVKKTKYPREAGKSRTANADLRLNNSKLNSKSQARGVK